MADSIFDLIFGEDRFKPKSVSLIDGLNTLTESAFPVSTGYRKFLDIPAESRANLIQPLREKVEQMPTAPYDVQRGGFQGVLGSTEAEKIDGYSGSDPTDYDISGENISNTDKFVAESLLGTADLMVQPDVIGKELSDIGQGYYQKATGDITNKEQVAKADATTEAVKGLLTPEGFYKSTYETGGALALPAVGVYAGVKGAQLSKALYDRGIQAGMSTRIYHGSPNEFTKFDASRSGSLNGQGHGAGIYLTDTKTTAKGYQPRDFDMEDSIMKLYDEASRTGDYKKLQVYESALLHESPKEIREYIDESYAGQDKSAYYDAINEYEKLYKQTQTHLYDIDLPDAIKDSMLIDDKKWIEQPEIVRDKMLMIGQNADLDVRNMTGEEFYYKVANEYYGGDFSQTSKMLDERGIKGLIYKDREAETVDEKPNNYVIYNPDNLIIRSRNDEMIPASVDESGFYMQSEKVLREDPREIYKDAGLLASIDKNGNIGGELLKKGVTKQELVETGLLNYLTDKKAKGESVDKGELLFLIDQNKPRIRTEFYAGAEDSPFYVQPYSADGRYGERGIKPSVVGEKDPKAVQYLVDKYSNHYEDELDYFGTSPDQFEYGLDEMFGDFVLATNNDPRFNFNSPLYTWIKYNGLAEGKLDEALERFPYLEDGFIAMAEKDALPTVKYELPFGYTIEGTPNFDLKVFKNGEDIGFAGDNLEKASEFVRDKAIIDKDYEPPKNVKTQWKGYTAPFFDPATYEEIPVIVDKKDLVKPPMSRVHGMGDVDEPYVYHLRTTERSDLDGQPYFYIDELQSDWHQKSRQADELQSEVPYTIADVEEKQAKIDEIRQPIVDFQQNTNVDVYQDAQNWVYRTAEGSIADLKYYADDKDYFPSGLKFDIDENYDEFTNDMIDFWDEVGKGKDNPFYSVSARDFYENHIDEFIDMAYERDYDKLAKYLGQIDDDLASFSSNTKVQKNISDYKNAMVLRDKAQAEYDKPENQKLVEEINRFHKAYPADRPPLGGKQGNEAFTKMGIKTAISRALDKGYDRVAWTPVENQVKIYGEIGERSRGLYKSIYEKAMPRDVKAIAKELGVNPDDILKKTKMQFPDDFGGVQEVWYIDLKPIKDKLINKKGNVVQKAYSATPAVPFGLLGMQEEEKGRMNPNKGLLQ